MTFSIETINAFGCIFYPWFEGQVHAVAKYPRENIPVEGCFQAELMSLSCSDSCDVLLTKNCQRPPCTLRQLTWIGNHVIALSLAVLFARVSVCNSLTGFTFHLTAPDKLAVTPLHKAHNLSIVAAATAQHVTTRGSVPVSPAFPPFRSQNASLQVPATVVWRLFNVHQIHFRNGHSANALLFLA